MRYHLNLHGIASYYLAQPSEENSIGLDLQAFAYNKQFAYKEQFNQM